MRGTPRICVHFSTKELILRARTAEQQAIGRVSKPFDSGLKSESKDHAAQSNAGTANRVSRKFPGEASDRSRLKRATLTD